MVHARTKVLQRRRDVTALIVRGLTAGEIAELLEIRRETIYNDIRVIRSGKYDSLFSQTRDQIVAQLFLNAQERARYLWRMAEEEEKGYVKVRAMTELRLNDERIVDRLSDPRINPYFTPEYSDADIQEWVDKYDGLLDRVRQMEKRREGWEEHLKKMDEEGRVIHHHPVNDKELREKLGMNPEHRTYAWPPDPDEH